jgi:hypothetical protein
MPEESKKTTFIVGVVLVVFSSLIIGFLNIGILYLLGTPFVPLLVGLGLVWFSKAALRSKLFATVLPIPALLLGFMIFYQILHKAEPETFLIADNFRGRFEIVYNEACGEAIKYENGRRLYTIPESGILIVNGAETLGVIDRKFELVDASGNRKKIPEFHWGHYDREREDWHWYLSGDKLDRETVGVFWAYTTGFSFIVSSYDSEENNKVQKELRWKEFEGRRNAILQECRSHYQSK